MDKMFSSLRLSSPRSTKDSDLKSPRSTPSTRQSLTEDTWDVQLQSPPAGFQRTDASEDDSKKLDSSPANSESISSSVPPTPYVLDKREWNSKSGRVNCISFSPDGSVFASGTSSDAIILWDVATNEPLKSAAAATTKKKTEVSAVAFSPDGEFVAWSAGNDIHIWKVTTQLDTMTMKGNMHPCSSLVFGSDGWFLYSVSNSDKSIRMWSTITGKIEKTIAKAHDATGTGIRNIIVCGSIVLTSAGGGKDTFVKAWNCDTLDHLWSWQEHTMMVNCIAGNASGTCFASCSDDKLVIVYDLVAMKCLWKLSGHTERVLSIAFHSDGSLLASAGARSIRLYYMVNGSCLQTLEGTADGITCVAFSQQGLLVAGGMDGKIRVWKN